MCSGTPAPARRPRSTPTTLASLYGFPPGNGQGECVAIIELGGGYRPADLKTYFSGLGITSAPTVAAMSVDHGKNHPTGDPNGPDGEVMLDIEVVGAVAPAAKIVVYFAPNTDQGFIDAVTTAAHDTSNRPSVISISWGGPKSSWTRAVDDGVRQCLPGRRGDGDHRLRRLGRQRLQRRRDRRRRITSTSRHPARTCWPAAAPACRRPAERSRARWCGTTARRAAPAAAASAASSRCRRGRTG